MHDGIDGEGRDALHAQLVHDVTAMGDDGGEADVQAVGNLLVDKALDNERHDFDFTVGKDLLFQHRRYRGEVAAIAVGMLLQLQQVADELALWLIDAERVEFG